VVTASSGRTVERANRPNAAQRNNSVTGYIYRSLYGEEAAMPPEGGLGNNQAIGPSASTSGGGVARRRGSSRDDTEIPPRPSGSSQAAAVATQRSRSLGYQEDNGSTTSTSSAAFTNSNNNSMVKRRVLLPYAPVPSERQLRSGGTIMEYKSVITLKQPKALLVSE
jgi:hypothetical protein